MSKKDGLYSYVGPLNGAAQALNAQAKEELKAMFRRYSYVGPLEALAHVGKVEAQLRTLHGLKASAEAVCVARHIDLLTLQGWNAERNGRDFATRALKGRRLNELPRGLKGVLGYYTAKPTERPVIVQIANAFAASVL